MSVGYANAEASDFGPGDTEVAHFGRNWGWFLVPGIAAILLGFVVLEWRTETLYALTYFAGAGFLFAGCVRLIDAIVVPERRLISLAGAVAFIAVGVTIFAWPNITLFIVALLIALGFVVWGVLELVTALANTRARHWWVGLIAGIASLIIAIWTTRHPGNALNVLMILVGIWLMLWGASAVVATLIARRVVKGLEHTNQAPS